MSSFAKDLGVSEATIQRAGYDKERPVYIRDYQRLSFREIKKKFETYC